MHDSQSNGVKPQIRDKEKIHKSYFARMVNTTTKENFANALPARRVELFFVFFVFYLFDVQLRSLIYSETLASFLSDFADGFSIYLEISFLVFLGSLSFLVYELLRKFYRVGLMGRTIAIFFLAAFVGILIRAFLQEGILRWVTGKGNYYDDTSIVFYFLDNSFYTVLYISLGAIFFFVQLSDFLVKRDKASQLTAREAELRYLKGQVNPHFLFNTLNNLYALVNMKSEKAMLVIEKLSGLLRYSLYEQRRNVPLEQEVEQLSRLVELEYLRLANPDKFSFEHDNLPSGYTIPPLLLTPFLENIFKHGDLSNDSNLAYAKLKLIDDTLFAEFSNDRKPINEQRDSVGGIGIQNVKQRLNLLFPSKHSLSIQEEDNRYFVALTIQLNPS